MKHNILWGIILLVASLSFTAKAQKVVQGQFSVKGILLDSLSNEGEPYSTIRISLKNNPAKPVKLAVTGADGRFDERLAVPGTYLIHFTSVGKSPVQKEFSISTNRKNVDLGKILIAEATEMLKGVEVVAQKPLVKAEIDKVTYSIEDDPDSKTNTTLEMLRKVPLVTVDGEDKIQVNGSSKFKVHVNGKPNNMMSNNPTEVLRSMPANSIKSIEVITEPGAKYDAEGVAGILNIITIGAGMEGYTVTLNGGASNTRVYGGGYGTVQSGKFTVTGNYSYNYQGSQKGFEDSYREDFTSQENKFLESHRRSKSYGNFQFGSLEGSYEIDTLNLISFSMNLMTGNFTNKRIGNTQMTNYAGNPVYGYGSLGNNESGFGEVGGNMDYQHSFKKKGELLTFSYRFSHSPNNSEANTDYEDTLNVPYLLQNQYFKNDASTQEHTAQLDYTNPINSIHSIETGIKYIFRRSKSDGKYYLADKTGEYKYDQDMSTQYDHKQDILAAYLGYQMKYKKLGGKAGIRYEHTFMDADYKNKDEKFDAQFDDLVPSLMFSYQLAPTQSLRASYNMRISRPGIWFLNPFTDTSNPTAISYGNPDLESEKAHSLSVTFGSFSQKFNVNVSANYSFVNNGIEQYSFIKDGVMNSTYDNIGKSKNINLSLFLNWNMSPKTRFNINGRGAYVDYRSSGLDLKNHGWEGNLFGIFQQTLPWDLRLSLNGGGGTPHISLQGKSSSFYYYAIGFSRSFLKEKRLTISLNSSNLFNKYITFKNNINTSTFCSSTSTRIPMRYYGFNISWRFGELKAQVKKAARSINNDDLKSGGGNAGTGGGIPAN